jgi:imidazoleglycerol-phosphate dehydratase
MPTNRSARIQRRTSETDIDLELSLDGTGESSVETGVGFFDHMLGAFARHGLFDIKLQCRGDLEVDAHHTVEDIGICLGQAINDAVGTKQGINRFGASYVPMDEALARSVVDLSGRPFLSFHADLQREIIGVYPAALTIEFFRSLADNAKMTLHIDLLRGDNAHHCVEAIFKAVARSLRQAVEHDPRVSGVPSTKGVL